MGLQITGMNNIFSPFFPIKQMIFFPQTCCITPHNMLTLVLLLRHPAQGLGHLSLHLRQNFMKGPKAPITQIKDPKIIQKHSKTFQMLFFFKEKIIGEFCIFSSTSKQNLKILSHSKSNLIETLNCFTKEYYLNNHLNLSPCASKCIEPTSLLIQLNTICNLAGNTT